MSVITESLIKYNSPIPKEEFDALISNQPANILTSAKPEDILNDIIPPKQINEDGTTKIQTVSSTPATRLDVINLQERLDKLLVEHKARETGICPIREEL